MVNKSTVTVTDECCLILFQAISISALQWISSKIRMDDVLILFNNCVKYRNVGSLRWFPSTKARSMRVMPSNKVGKVLSKFPSMTRIFVNANCSKFFFATAATCGAPSKVMTEPALLEMDDFPDHWQPRFSVEFPLPGTSEGANLPAPSEQKNLSSLAR